MDEIRWRKYQWRRFLDKQGMNLGAASFSLVKACLRTKHWANRPSFMGGGPYGNLWSGVLAERLGTPSSQLFAALTFCWRGVGWSMISPSSPAAYRHLLCLRIFLRGIRGLEISMLEALGEWMCKSHLYANCGCRLSRRTGATHASIAHFGPGQHGVPRPAEQAGAGGALWGGDKPDDTAPADPAITAACGDGTPVGQGSGPWRAHAGGARGVRARVRAVSSTDV